jgi:hypothetical protein
MLTRLETAYRHGSLVLDSCSVAVHFLDELGRAMVRGNSKILSRPTWELAGVA